ncbi:MAG: reverse transcriptase domain-containing protein, partial [bacterium]
LVAGGQKTDPPQAMTYASVVSRESVRIAFLLAALNDLDVKVTDIGNAYLNAKTTEKVYSVAGPEFREFEGHIVIVVRALYGLKSAGASWRAHLAVTLRELGFKSSLGDPDVWLRSAVKDDGTEYYEYILVYLDDLLIISAKSDNILTYLSKYYRLKDMGSPTRYLGATIGRYRDINMDCWYISAKEYLEKALPVIEARYDLTKIKADQPLPTSDHPELDTSPQLDDDTALLYMSYIGILQWAVELGRIDVTLYVSLMARYMACPRRDHLQKVLQIFAFLKKHLRSKLVLDPEIKNWDDREWINTDWTEYYPDASEIIPANAVTHRGHPVQINVFCDAAHATDIVTRKSVTGILIFLNSAPIKWYSKRQNTVESSTFGSEFIALKIAVEMVEGLRYKLRMFGVPLDGPANGFCDNNSVVRNVTDPASTLKKRHNSIAYHKVRESAAAGIIRICYENGKYNVADMLTKILSAKKLKDCCKRCLY